MPIEQIRKPSNGTIQWTQFKKIDIIGILSTIHQLKQKGHQEKHKPIKYRPINARIPQRKYFPKEYQP